MDKTLVRDYEWMYIVLAAGLGLLWGILSLVAGLPWLFAHHSGLSWHLVRTLILPVNLAFVLARSLHIELVDPTPFVLTGGLILGVALVMVYLVVQRCRGR